MTALNLFLCNHCCYGCLAGVSADQIGLEKAESKTKTFGLVFQKCDGQLKIHQSCLLDEITWQLALTLFQIASMNLLFVLTQKRDNFAEHVITPLILVALWH